MAEMHTLGGAARLLRISRHTLDKWLERLSIEPQRHEWDYRFYIISDEELQKIREARAQMPGHAPVTPSYSPNYTGNALRDDSDGLTTRDASPIVTPTPHPRPLQRRPLIGDILPDGLVSRSELAEMHGVALTTMRRWCDAGRIDTDGGVYASEAGRFSIAHPVTRRGQQQFYQIASGRPGWIACPDCPHDWIAPHEVEERDQVIEEQVIEEEEG